MSYINRFGKTPAAEILAEKLVWLGDDNLSRKVGKLFAKYTQILKELEKLNPHIALALGTLHYKHTKGLAIGYPREIKTYLLNVIHATYSRWENKLRIISKIHEHNKIEIEKKFGYDDEYSRRMNPQDKKYHLNG